MTSIANRTENACFIFCGCDPCAKYPCSRVIDHVYNLDEKEENEMAMRGKTNEDFAREIRGVGEYLVKNAEKIFGNDACFDDEMNIIVELNENCIPSLIVKREFDIFGRRVDEREKTNDDFAWEIRKAGEYLVKNADYIVGDMKSLTSMRITMDFFDRFDPIVECEKNILPESKTITL